MIATDDKTDVIEKTDTSVEQLLPSRAVLAPKPTSKEEIGKILSPTKVKDKHTEYPRKEDINRKDIGPGGDDEGHTDEKDHEKTSCK